MEPRLEVNQNVLSKGEGEIDAMLQIAQLNQAEDVPDKVLPEAKGAQAGQMLKKMTVQSFDFDCSH